MYTCIRFMWWLWLCAHILKNLPDLPEWYQLITVWWLPFPLLGYTTWDCVTSGHMTIATRNTFLERTLASFYDINAFLLFTCHGHFVLLSAFSLVCGMHESCACKEIASVSKIYTLGVVLAIDRQNRSHSYKQRKFQKTIIACLQWC